MYGVLLHTVPYADASRLVVLHEREIRPGSGPASISYGDYQDWSEQSRTLESLAIARETQFNLAGAGKTALAERIDGAFCSWTLFPALATRPLMGRWFKPSDDRAGAARVVI